MIDALIRGERDPHVLADLARGTMRTKRRDLVRALDGRFDDHHAELATILLAQIDNLSTEIDKLTTRIEQLITELPAAGPSGHRDAAATPEHRDTGPDPTPPPATLHRLAGIPGISPQSAQVILAEIGPDMSRFPTARHLVAWARLSPQLKQSGAKRHNGQGGEEQR